MTDEVKIPVHQWTNHGKEVLVLRCIPHDGKTSSYRLVDEQKVDAEPFQNPLIVGESVTAPDWNPKPICGGGIHCWPWGLGIGSGKDPIWSDLWQVYSVLPEDIVTVEDGSKAKFSTGILRFSGKWFEATNFLLAGQMAWVHHNARGSASATGARGSASATGWSGSASAEGKECCAVSLGIDARAKGVIGCWLTIAEWKQVDNEWHRIDVQTAQVDGEKIKADTFYKLVDGLFVKA